MATLSQRLNKRRPLHSFTLLELLTVLAICSVLTILSVLAFTQIRFEALTTGSQMLAGALDLARQTAITRNGHVEFRIYQLPDYNGSPTDSPTVYRAFQTFLISSNSTNALTKVSFLPNPVILSSNGTSTIATLMTPTIASVSGIVLNQPLPKYNLNYNAVSFRFSALGSLELSTNSQWYLTLSIENAAVTGTTGLPNNFVTIQIDPFSGRAKTFRP